MNEKNSINKNNLGFTLAEVLVTLVIIGVVAALTIPAIAYSVQKSTWIEAMKKTYSSLSQATNLIMQDNGSSIVGVFTSHDDMMNIYAGKISFAKTCLAGQDAGVCFHDGVTSWHTLDGDNGWSDPTTFARALGNDGVLYRFKLSSSACTDSPFKINGVNSGCGYILFDVNGFKGPNTAGKDIFMVDITKDGLFIKGATGSIYYESDWATHCNPSSTDSENGITCGHRIMQQGGMNY